MRVVQNTYENKLSDEALMEVLQAKKGKTEGKKAFTELYHRYGDALLNYFFRMLWKDREKAEDFLHDLFSKVFDKCHQYDSSRKFKTWLYSIANNMCKNEYKKQSVRSNTSTGIESYTEIVGKEEDHVDKKTHLQLFKEEFESAIKALDEKHSTVFTLRHLQGLSIKEIADAVAISEGTVKSRLFHATKKLALQLSHFNTEVK